jgi:hypothetical protein
MNLNKYNIFSNIRNDQFLPNIVEGDNDSSFNSDENTIINNQILIPLEPNDFIRSDDNIFDNGNYGNNLDQKNYRMKMDNKAKIFFKTRIEMLIPKPFLENEICILFKKMNIDKETKIKFISSLNKFSIKKEEIKNKLSLNKNERRKNLDNKINIKDKFKTGRKLKNDISRRSHNKYSFDNLVDKIKNMINTSLLFFCNKVIKTIYENNTEIKQIFTNTDLPKKTPIKKLIYNFRRYLMIKERRNRC